MLFVYLTFFKQSLFAKAKIYNMLILNLTHSLISLLSKFWYQLLTMTLSILRKLNKLFNKVLRKQKIMVNMRGTIIT